MKFDFIFYIFSTLGIIFALSSALLFTSTSNSNLELVLTYECGFSSFNESRFSLNVNFYIIALLFILSDLEVILFFPLIIVIMRNGLFVVFLSYLLSALTRIGYFFEMKLKIFNIDDFNFYIFSLLRTYT